MAVDLQKQIEKIDIDYILSSAKEEFLNLSNSTLLLTGGGGFLGFYFIKSIIEWNNLNSKRKINLVILSTFKKGVPSWIRKLHEEKQIVLLKKDVTTYTIPKSFSFNYIIHGASIASPIIYRQFPIETINANVKGLYNILQYVVEKKSIRSLRGMLYFSSSEIYGDPPKSQIPTLENYRGNVSCTGPRSCYDEAKRFCETLCVNYSQVYNLPIKTARPFNNYGPGMKITDGRVIADFSRNILSGNDLYMFSNGAPSRTFCYVADAIVGYFKILAKGRKGQAYNIGVKKPEISVEELGKIMIKIANRQFGYEGKIVKGVSNDKEYLSDNPQRRCPDIQKAQKELGFNPQISLEEGITRTLKWYKKSI